MLKSFSIIDKLAMELELLISTSSISDFKVELTLSQRINAYIVSDTIKSVSDMGIGSEYIDKYDVRFEFISDSEKNSEDYSYLFEDGVKINYGVRRSLHNLIEPKKQCQELRPNVVTFYSYKGGVGRTTSIALFARYYANLGKKVFVLDCDFEAPGLINFFGVSQFDNPKNGIVEYINDKKFDSSINLNEDYVYEVSSAYSGEGRINMMPAGNVFGADISHYLEGLARVDMNGPNALLNEFNNIFQDIEKNYEPDVILVDSRTGFNNVFGALSQLSHTIVGIAGDDHQNEPGLSMLLDQLNDENLQAKLCLVFSIVSSSIPRRVSAFRTKVENLLESELNIPIFHFQRASELELIGTDSESLDDVQFFTSDRSSFYFPFFDYLSTELMKNSIESEKEIEVEEAIEELPPVEQKETLKNQVVLSDTDTNDDYLLQNRILGKLVDNFPQQYAEQEKYTEEFYRNKFFIRQCMQDLFLPEYKILLGGKGTGKTAFYKALQEKSFFEVLTKRAEKKHLKFSVQNIISEPNSNVKSGFINFSTSFDDILENESRVRKLWVTYIWLSIASKYNMADHQLYFEIKDDSSSAQKFVDIIESRDKFNEIEASLTNIDNMLKSKDERLIITFDQLDFVVKPIDWDNGISPLIRLCQSNTWSRIQPKLFLRRDLFNKLGNITNKNSLSNQIINLEWSQGEMYAFLFKVIFSVSNDDFIEYLRKNLPHNFIEQNVVKKLKRANQFNQLPADEFTLKPLVESFFGASSYSYTNAYDELYNNLKNADKTVSLRPFLDLIRLAIEEQKKDGGKKRAGSILSVKYCDNKFVRSQAVDNYFNDLAKETGNELIRHFVGDIRNNLVPTWLKCSSLEQHDFEELVECVRRNHPELSSTSVTEFEEDLKLNGIIFVTYIAGHRKKYSFAYLYKYYLDLISPKAMAKANKLRNSRNH
ncbi:KGGVGR-motif variant AAA ATPase [Vibrio crassostreae]|uniref:KGGVGR-motif variant AAA ATPase n=1 Tax=Vibrio crassostreae TaxID=246167 RepID=UPI000F504813|nr:AAA family ATPase [Vibrio crassostreae]RPF00879.1 CobQ/CobB/MinD/ParA family nucleotide binding protein [Vibrio crassostreae]TCV28069.1 CobQ/CobB/MinD/ParA family nucleotide binding protein [Vibrio crassostreae]TWD38599.1 CobQ/CobB/MinD/ParA family nucleotide binding protein [Vibrio crassostreae]